MNVIYTTEDIAELFPDINEIEDITLREKVAAVWTEAITTGCGGAGWTFEELRKIKFTLLAGDIDLRFIEHLNSCVKQCMAIADVLGAVFGDRVPIDRDILIAGALLADVGKPLEYDKNVRGNVVKGHFGEMLRHPFSGVALCYKHELPPEVMHIVATHSQSRSSSTTPTSSTSTSRSTSALAREPGRDAAPARTLSRSCRRHSPRRSPPRTPSGSSPARRCSAATSSTSDRST
ncbi:MAG: HDIG domain-containing metalloprotein [Planctomycetota bacterium]|jgi:putative nucleotidyltransferase with HDIG domain